MMWFIEVVGKSWDGVVSEPRVEIIVFAKYFL